MANANFDPAQNKKYAFGTVKEGVIYDCLIASAREHDGNFGNPALNLDVEIRDSGDPDSNPFRHRFYIPIKYESGSQIHHFFTALFGEEKSNEGVRIGELPGMSFYGKFVKVISSMTGKDKFPLAELSLEGQDWTALR